MELKLVRGIATNLSPEDKNGRLSCRVGEQSVLLHRDLTNGAKEGDEVLVGGELHQDVVHVYALNNLTRRKLYKIDYTFQVLGAGLGSITILFGLIFMAQSESAAGAFFGNAIVDSILVAAGTALMFLSLRRLPLINKLSRWVERVND